jgi:hypothetical protein
VTSLASLLISAAFLLAAACAGRLVSGTTRSDKGPASERLLVDASLGLGLLSLVFFALSALQLLRFLIPAFAVLLVALGAMRAGSVLSDVSAVLAGAIHRRSLSSWLLALLLSILALLALIPALAPPSMGDWDSLAYHLAVPKLYLHHGGFYYINYASHSNFPFLMEMLYLPGVALDLPAAAKMMHYWTAVLLVAAVAVLARRHLSTRAAPMAAIAIAGMPIVLWEATTAYIDLATALYSVLSVHLLLDYLDSSDRKYLFGCGIAAGFAASTKMTGLALVPMLVVWLLADRLAERRLEWKPALLLAVVSTMVCSPWYAKSIVYTGNPVYPFFHSVFGGRNWTAQLAANYTMLQKQFGMGEGFASFLMLPYELTFRSDMFYDRPGLFVGPLFLAAVPFLALGRYESRKLLGLLLFFLAQLVVWFSLTQQSRYLIPAFAVLAPVVSEIAHQGAGFAIARRVLTGILVLTALFGALTMLPIALDTAPVVLGVETRDRYLSRTLDVYNAQQFINSLRGNTKVALFGDTRGYYLNTDFVWADPGHNTLFTREYESLDEFVAHLKLVGVTHALINFNFLATRERADRATRFLYCALKEERLRQVYPAGDPRSPVAVFEVR